MAYKSVAPKANLDPEAGTTGAWEIAFRYGRLTIDEDTFPIFANPEASAREATDAAVGFNWHLSRFIKIQVDYSLTEFEGGAAGGTDREDEKVILSRLQFAF